jgi:hypothetical protein
MRVMPIDPYAEDRRVLAEVTEPELLRHARSMIWLAEFQANQAGRDTFTMRRDLAVAELQRRGIDVESVRAEFRN